MCIYTCSRLTSFGGLPGNGMKDMTTPSFSWLSGWLLHRASRASLMWLPLSCVRFGPKWQPGKCKGLKPVVVSFFLPMPSSLWCCFGGTWGTHHVSVGKSQWTGEFSHALLGKQVKLSVDIVWSGILENALRSRTLRPGLYRFQILGKNPSAVPCLQVPLLSFLLCSPLSFYLSAS